MAGADEVIDNRVDVAYWHECDIARSQMDVRFRGKSGRAADITGTTGFDSFRKFGLRTNGPCHVVNVACRCTKLRRGRALAATQEVIQLCPLKRTCCEHRLRSDSIIDG